MKPDKELFSVSKVMCEGTSVDVFNSIDMVKYQERVQEFLVTRVVKTYLDDGTSRILCKNNKLRVLYDFPYQLCSIVYLGNGHTIMVTDYGDDRKDFTEEFIDIGSVECGHTFMLFKTDLQEEHVPIRATRRKYNNGNMTICLYNFDNSLLHELPFTKCILYYNH